MLDINNSKSPFKTGMYLLETLTAGMYNDPLSIYREYIQNSVDSIDTASAPKTHSSLSVRIDLDPFEKKITIYDDGYGLPSEIAEETLNSIGRSSKLDSSQRGFRGIGRLAGIAFCDKVVFQTKFHGEAIESRQVWDCIKLRHHLSENTKIQMSLFELLASISSFRHVGIPAKEGSYFKVTLEGVTSFRNNIFDIQKVRKYLSEIAPVPFCSDHFSYGEEIDGWLMKSLNHYGLYNIFLNGQPIFKPYKDSVKVTKSSFDKIVGVKKVEIKMGNKIVAFGWYGLREKMLGAIARGEGTSGIRVRVGNILIGDSHLLDGCFREPRFNSYMVGELHVQDPNLIPNSRRDDFVDNDTKTLFYNAIEKEIGLSISKEIRAKSRQSTLSYEEKKPQSQIKSNDISQKIISHRSSSKIVQEIIEKFKNTTELNNLLSKYGLF